MHFTGIITTLPFSKVASPLSSQKLRLLVDLRKINNLISDNFCSNNYSLITLTDAAQHLAGKKVFNKFDCSQAQHVLKMAYQKSVQLLAFNFASAQKLNDIGRPTNNPEENKNNPREELQCVRSAGLRLTIAKCPEQRKPHSLVQRSPPLGVTPQNHKIQAYILKPKVSKTKKGFQR